MKPSRAIAAAAALFIVAVLGALWFRAGSGVSDQALKEALESTTPAVNSTVALKTVLENMVGGQEGKRLEAVYGGTKADNEALAKLRFGTEQTKAAQEYFALVVSTPQTARLYEKAKTVFGATSEGDGAARWVTLGGIMESSPVYGDTLSLALQEANRNPAGVKTQLDRSIETVRKDPFLYQMSFNLVYQLALDPSDRARFYGQELEAQLKALTPAARPADAFWVAELGLMFSQQAGVNGRALEPYLRRGLKESKGPAEVLREFKNNARFYFSELDL